MPTTERLAPLVPLILLVALPGYGASSDVDASLASMMDSINVALEAGGAEYRAVKAEYLSLGEGNGMGNEVVSKDVGNKQLGFDFVPFDERRIPWSGPIDGGMDDVTYAVDTTFDAVPPLGGLTAAQTDAAIDRAMQSWDAVACSALPIVRNPDLGIDIGVAAFLDGLGGSPFVFADIQHAGWRDVDLLPGVLGLTVTFAFIDSSGRLTDIDHNGKADAAFREIYYDPGFPWADDGTTSIDVESIALHEAGHGLSQAHFGKVFVQRDGTVQFAPRAVMNAVYVSPSRTLLGTDTGGHCSNWANWPEN